MNDPIVKVIIAARISLLIENKVPVGQFSSLPLEERPNLQIAIFIDAGVLCFSREIVKSLTMEELKLELKRAVTGRTEP
ncbi:hypothetical protein [Rhizobium ruizarguesonis]|uniref:hypothetical protein n=1 Tax=Rhizobium ruizarguesonis TaxID=2081791 RepID=UPI001031D856|nr:hypothetical protein [Rhizobium ruizarguesonis]TBB81001.1 hypothetical protein ELH38_33450 [Rhizobium ruizarguesonis]TBC40078.1 hypothetical protein ELH29_33850 [Rhizobium ruizarguesonis]